MAALDLKADLLAKAQRRTVYVKLEANLMGLDVAVVRAALRSLQRQGLIYASDRGKPAYWGGIGVGYRATLAADPQKSV